MAGYSNNGMYKISEYLNNFNLLVNLENMYLLQIKFTAVFVATGVILKVYRRCSV